MRCSGVKTMSMKKQIKSLYINPQNIETAKGEDVFYCVMTGIPVVIGGTFCYAELFQHLLKMGIVAGDENNFTLNVPLMLREDLDTLRVIPKDVELDYFWKPKLDPVAVAAQAAATMASTTPAGVGPQFPGFPGAGIVLSYEAWETVEAKKVLGKQEYLDDEYKEELEYKPTVSWDEKETK